MKKITAILILSLTTTFVKAQADYYDYNDSPITVSGISRSGTPMVRDENNNVFYIHGDGRVHCLSKSTGSWTDAATNSFPASTANGLLYTPYPAHIFYIYGNKIRNVYKNGATWSDDYLNALAPNVLTGTSLTIDENGIIYYVKTDGTFEKIWWNAGWQYAAVPVLYGQGVMAKTGNKIHYKNGHLFYVGIDNKIYNLWLNGTSWQWGILNPGAPLAMNKTSLYADNAGKLFYVSQDGSLMNFYYDLPSSSWYYGALNNAAPKASSAIPEFAVNGDQIFYVSKNNGASGNERIFCIFWDECKWYWTDLNNTSSTVFANGPLVLTDNTLCFPVLSDLRIHSYEPPFNESTHPFVYVKGRKLMDHGNVFNMKCVNYLVSVNSDQNPTNPTYSLGLYGNYASATLTTIQSQLNDIKARGFNTVRIMGNYMMGFKHDFNSQGNTNCSRFSDPGDTKMYFSVTSNTAPWYTDVEYNTSTKTQLFSVINDILTAAQNVPGGGLKVILTTGLRDGDNTSLFPLYTSYLSDLADNFKNNTSILAYDVWNEPNFICYLAQNNPKSLFCSATRDWYNSIRNKSSSQLVTIGLYAGFTQSWDPAILSADFIGFHPYPWGTAQEIPYNQTNAMSRWKNDMYYIASVMQDLDKPWVVEETSFLAAPDGMTPAPNDWGTEADQKAFAINMINKAKYCGAAGYGWWQYHDVAWDADAINNPGENFLGLYDNNGNPKQILGAGSPFLSPEPSQTCDCSPMPNYYNYYNKSTYTLKGIVTGTGGIPLKNAWISASNWRTGEYEKTYSYDDGSFFLQSDTQLLDALRVSAPGYETTVFPYPSYSYTGNMCDFSTITLTSANCQPYNKNMHPDFTPPLKKPESGELSVIPNPTSGIVKIQSLNEDPIRAISVYNGQGELITTYFPGSSFYQLDLSGNNDGLYILRIEYSGKITLKKIIVTR